MAARKMVRSDQFHYKWSRRHEPVLEVKPGETVTFKVNEVTSGQITERSTIEDILSLDAEKFYPLAGPVRVDGARRGDALVVDVLSVKPARWGWSAIIPGFGLLDEFREPFLWIWDLSRGRRASFKNGIALPVRPFCGVYGVAPEDDGYHDVMPPGKHGGNMDNRHLTAGSRIYIPVWVDGALFSLGDVHAAQGDGEVCVTAIECPGEATVRLGLKKGAGLTSPHYEVQAEAWPRRGYYGTTGIAPDLMEASRLSLRAMISHLVERYNLSREEAYILCSVSADLRIHEVVDRPNWVVGTMIPLDILPSPGRSRAGRARR
jgi:acetamidase/formamidase